MVNGHRFTAFASPASRRCLTLPCRFVGISGVPSLLSTYTIEMCIRDSYNITYKSTSGRRRSDSAFYNSQRKIWYWDEEEEKEVAREIVAWASLPAPVSYTHLDVYKRQA